jgi:trehalose synthase
MHGVLTAFASVDTGRLALVGPDPSGIPDDVEQAHWFATCHRLWTDLPAATRSRVRLICLPMTDLDHNAALVNAAQRTAAVVTQKSIAEGFGLTVTEAMWKSRPVVASAVGGLNIQLNHGVNGLLLNDPTDLTGFAQLLTAVLDHTVDGHALGIAAHATVRARYLPDWDLVGVADLLSISAVGLPAEHRGE